MNQRTTYGWMLSRLTYVQTFLLICLIFFLSLLPILYFWVKIHANQIRQIDNELREIEEEVYLKQLFSQVQKHRYLVRHYLTDNPAYKSNLEKLDLEIRDTLKNILEISQLSPNNSSEEDNSTLWQRIEPEKIITTWRAFSAEGRALSLTKSMTMHTILLQNLQVEFAYLNSRIRPEYLDRKGNYPLVNNLSARLPFLQENLSQLTLLKEEEVDSKNKNLEAEQIKILKDRVILDLNFLQQTIKTSGSRQTKTYESTLHLWDQYVNAIQEFLQFIDPQQKTETPDPFSQEKLLELARNFQSIGALLWDNSLDNLKNIFLIERKNVRHELWFVLIMTLLLEGVALTLGILATRLANARLVQLTEATQSFTDGKLSVRVPVMIDDEIGRQAQAFNRMAQKLEEMISFLYELLRATTALAGGNLSARLTDTHHNKEFDQVAQSFNKMAETFETIIGRLQQVGTTLTTSATQIAASSQEQETMIVGQETTTHNIALSAREISSTAKAFAATMNDMSQVADHTSRLALAGKDSLNHMEAIMHQMVDASGTIANRLAILNEKASNITTVITTITKVADQTNLLSLNASIEAEKAGEYGRSFAVIAREIRRLADQTAAATLDIEKIVNEIMGAVTSTVLGVDDFTQDIRKGVEDIRSVSGQQSEIIEQVEAFTSRFEMLNQGMQNQSNGAEQIDFAITQLSQTAQQTTAAIHQLHKTIQELNDAANALHLITISIPAS